MTEINAFILDLDGVVTDTAEYHFRAWKQLADEENVPFTREDNEHLRGVSRRRSLELLLGEHLERYTEDHTAELMARKNGYYQEMLHHITAADLLPGVSELLDDLKRRGLKIAIGSASKNTTTVLTRLGILDLFDGIADGNVVTRAKPAPDVFIYAAGMVGIPVAQCVVVEDAESGIEAALISGMIAVGIGPETRVGKAHFRYDSTADINLETILDGKI
ncbi:MAG: beta-phosphoglucomutase [Chloroflexi bacterium AL-W]|nr:beta-phosphoglucomutase [Chloroflexi bacterium AL-N1]NOK68120.1 beta-phosphoglucomutase [Chloroflexi bacterium AL-N10]NOK73460.1 beta-phosphoglucomutase [Chloroflexi bacterium AL-N5]NOK83374.1 beta-phosphoglucomutase [Chloroflexi bacterium AL-W]NOK87791.1 beta-phosphoglucomutase [Chloroflexi bacterium AL-N15]